MRIVSGYMTISVEAAAVIARSPPMDLLAKKLAAMSNGGKKETCKEALNREWHERWDATPKGRCTHRLI